MDKFKAATVALGVLALILGIVLILTPKYKWTKVNSLHKKPENMALVIDIPQGSTEAAGICRAMHKHSDPSHRSNDTLHYGKVHMKGDDFTWACAYGWGGQEITLGVDNERVEILTK